MEKETVKEKEEKKEKLSKEIESKFNQSKETPKEIEAKFSQVKETPQKLEKELEKMEKPKKKRKWIPIAISIAIIIILALIFSTIFALLNINKETIASGVKIKGIDVSGLTAEEAKGKIETIYQEKKEKEISIKYEDYETAINPTIIETNYDIEVAIKEATSIGRKGNIFANNYEILFALLEKKDIDVNMTVNEEVAKKTIEDIGTNLPGVVIESGYYIEKNQLIITKGQKGVKIDTDKLLDQVKQYLKTPEKSDEYIGIPVVIKEPEKIDIDQIHTEVYKEVKDAYYTKNPFTIYPEVEGVDFDVEAAKKMLEEDKEEYVIDLTITKPKVTVNQIGTEAFPDQLATFTTNYDGGDKDRTTNLQIACQKINGKVLLAGETFSYNQTLGPRTAAAGYKNAKVYEAGQVVDGIGGGICQISSTLYDAVVMANLNVTTRRNHQFVTSYLPAGKDATVVWGSQDFKFVNTRKYPVRIVATVEGGVATIQIWGIKEEVEYDISIETKKIATIAYTTQYVQDASLPAGQQKVVQAGSNGRKVEAYKVTKLNGQIVSTTLLSRDTYNAMQRIVHVGTGQ